MKIVIISSEADYHAAAAKWALTEAGYQVIQWEGVGYQQSRQASISMGSQLEVTLGRTKIESEDCVWFRRPYPFSLHPGMDPTDSSFAKAEGARFYENLAAALEAKGCRCVNPLSAARDVNRKAAQLLLAHELGIDAPNTLMGNSPRDVAKLPLGQIPYIFKSFLPHSWGNTEKKTLAMAAAARFTLPEAEDQEVIAFAPGIFQSYIDKASDVRVFACGDVLRAFSIQSEALDYRIDSAMGKVHVAEIEISLNLRLKLSSFLKVMKVPSGSFDFVIDRAGKWWFLEFNESGQFLWIDTFLPSANLMQDFLAFLSGDSKTQFRNIADFKWDLDAIPAVSEEEQPFSTLEK